MVNNIIAEVTSEEFLNLEPVLAGGFVLWLYKTSQGVFGEAQGALNALESVRSSFGINQLGQSYVGKTWYQIISQLRQSDIDSWFLSDNVIWDESHEFHGLVNSEVKLNTHEAGSKVGFKSLEYESAWANTFSRIIRVDNHKDSLQVIKKEYKTITELLSNFDLDNCKIAWHNGEFYISDEFMEAHADGCLRFGEEHWKTAHHIQKVHSALRAFKYHKRTGLFLDHGSVDKLFVLYQEVLDHDVTKKHITGFSITGKIVTSLAKVVHTLSPRSAHALTTGYGANRRRNKSAIVQLHSKLLDSFDLLLIQPEFSSSMMMFFLNTGHAKIDKKVKGAMEYFSGGKVEPEDVSEIESSMFDDLFSL